MDRRGFITALFCVTGTAAALASAPAQAMSVLTPPIEPLTGEMPATAILTDAELAEAKAEEAYYYIVRRRRYRRRRRYGYRRRYRRYCRYYRDGWGRLWRRCG